MEKQELENPVNENTNEINANNNTENSNHNEIIPQPEEEKYIELEKKHNELNDKYLRLYSEFDNFRKRTIKEKLDLRKTAAEDIILSILPVVDDFERANQSMQQAKDIDAVIEGIMLVYNKLKNILNQQGVEEIQTIGTKFDPEIHEAITNIPADTEEKKGTIIDQTQKGYSIGGKVIRFPKVIVAS